MRKLAAGLIVLVLASIVACDAANAAQQGFSHSPVHLQQPRLSILLPRATFHRPFIRHCPGLTFYFPVMLTPFYSNYCPFYLPRYDSRAGYAPITSIQQASEPAAPQVSIQQAAEPSTPQVWYYCKPVTGYRPYVQSCGAGWHQLSTTPQ